MNFITMLNALIIFGAKYLVFLMIAISGIFFLLTSKELKKKTAIFASCVLPLSFLLAKALSFFFYNPRPFVVGNFVPLISHAADNGFPSDHTLLAGAIAAITFYFNKKAGILLWVLALAVGVARVLAGVHRVQDIAGSIVIVLFVSFLSQKFLESRK